MTALILDVRRKKQDIISCFAKTALHEIALLIIKVTSIFFLVEKQLHVIHNHKIL